MNKQTVYKLRAECFVDINKLIQHLGRHSDHALGEFKVIPQYLSGHRIPDCELEIKSSLSLNEIIDLIKKIPDSHVMKETIQPIKAYTGARLRPARLLKI